MKNLFLITALILASFQVQADQCADLAQQMSGSTSNMTEALNRKHTIQAYNTLCNGGQAQQPQQQQPPQPVNTEPHIYRSMVSGCQRRSKLLEIASNPHGSAT